MISFSIIPGLIDKLFNGPPKKFFINRNYVLKNVYCTHL